MTWLSGFWNAGNVGLYGHLLSVVTYALTIVFTAVLLRSRRTPASVVAWFAVIAFVPYVGIPLFLMVGGRKMGVRHELRKAPIYKRRVPYRETQNSVRRLERILRSAGAPGARANDRFELLEGGEQSYDALVESIRGARRSIDLATFILKRDDAGRSILAELTRKAAAGVRVRLLLDAVGSNALIRPSLRDFRRAGGETAFFMPLLHIPFKGRINLRNHRKLAVFDEATAWFGGMNLALEYMGPSPSPRRWTDLSMRLRGPSVHELRVIFASDWAFATGRPPDELTGELTGESPKKPPEPALWPEGSVPGPVVQVVASGPDVPGDPLYEALLEACFEASSRIWIATPYFVPDESLIKALELACRRGVDVRVLTPAHSNHPAADLSRGSYVRELLAAGGRVYRYPRMLHAKLVVIDDALALAGSANFDLRSLLYNYEIGVFLYSRPEIDAASAWMESHFEGCAEGYPRAGFWRDLAEGVGRIFGPLL